MIVEKRFRPYFNGIVFFISIRATQQPELSTVSYTVKTPCGVVGLITPWNLPVYLLSFKIAPAMAAGCCIVAKPSEMTSVTAWMLCKVFKEAGKVLDFNLHLIYWCHKDYSKKFSFAEKTKFYGYCLF